MSKPLNFVIYESKPMAPGLMRNAASFCTSIWLVLMSFWLWVNLLSTSWLILWPELREENEFIEQALWLNEFFWVMDILRKFFLRRRKHAKGDLFDNAIAYLKSSFIFDLISTLPQVASGLSQRFMYLKFIRIYNFKLLHYPLEAFVRFYLSNSDEKYRQVVIYACASVSRILILLHFLAIIWIWIGSETFSDIEPGYTPWLIGSSHF